MTLNGQSNGCKMAPFANKDFCRLFILFFSHFQMANKKEKEYNETLMDCIQNDRCTILVHISFYKKYKASCMMSIRSTQRAVLQKSCSTVGILLGKLIQFCVDSKMNYICWETFLENVLLNGHYRRKATLDYL